ncbi:YdeI/OmpD-associated family protein [Ornithinimicrobium sp. F0845]|uniref:YdeI/OmpD-associated family protein n=1 Tax=Ornithinimicrobium sp. F0845 TaxID=2926412 RepID=UPI001FF102FE|nr:YdeI/OmpD-associated family protein [Ornithinimicrobium sp. F0845]MCK0113493.1 YdeI/OmpD-associated family protein [Ornithinimicrobium sp. F0845]
MTEHGRMGGTPERPARFFASAEEFDAWLAAHHDSETELWMGLHKKHVPDHGLTWADAVPVALCWGWIDSVAQRIDEDSRRQRWTPRRAGSNWSAINIALVEELIAGGRMQPSGLAVFEARREDASAVYSYERPEQALTEQYAAQLAASAAATAFWEVAPPSYRRLALTWVLTAKQEATRDRRMTQLVEDSAAGLLIRPQRYGDVPKWVERAAAAAAES